MEEQKKKEKDLQIEADKQIAQGIYSNFAMVSHTREEFILDFVFIQPQPSQPKVGTLRSRIITSPEHMKRIFRALGENIGKYEKKHGEIKEVAATDSGETTRVQ